jgi:hypothetical protein
LYGYAKILEANLRSLSPRNGRTRAGPAQADVLIGEILTWFGVIALSVLTFGLYPSAVNATRRDEDLQEDEQEKRRHEEEVKTGR